MSKLLFDSQPLIVLPELACAIGLNQAIVLQQVHYWLEINKKAGKNFRDGRFWVYNSYESWNENFPWWSITTLKRVFSSLEKQDLLLTGNFNKMKMDKTKWYSVNYDKLGEIAPCNVQNCEMHLAESPSPSYQNDTMDSTIMNQAIPETIKETNQMTYNVHKGSPSTTLNDARFDKRVLSFISWYKDEYFSRFGTQHPNIKRAQLERVHDTIYDFFDFSVDDEEIGCLIEMAETFFERVKSDHNINHFATEGILTMRYYDAGLY